MASRLYGQNIQLPSLDYLFSTEEERQEAKLEKVQNIPLEELHPFREHPFGVREDAEMQKLAESIREYGVLSPALARPRPEGGYELIAGHRRQHAARLAGLETLPVIVRELDDEAATILMVDSNCQREHVLPMEKARAYRMKLEAIKRQGERRDLTSCQVGTKFRADESIAENLTESARQIQRYIRLNDLIPPLQALVDAGELKFNPAVELSYLSPQEQTEFFDYIDSMRCTPSLSQAQKLKAASRDGLLDAEKIASVMLSQPPSAKPRERQVLLAFDSVAQYFPQGYTAEQMAAQILKLLEARHRSRQREER